MLEKKPLLSKGKRKKKLSKAEELRGAKDVISKRFDHLAVRHKDLNLKEKMTAEIRKYLKSRRDKGFPVEERVLKQQIVQIKRKLLKEHQLIK